MKYNSILSEWTNLMMGINKASIAADISPLISMNLSGIATIANKMSSFTSAPEMVLRNVEMMAKPLEMMYMSYTQLSGAKTIVSEMESISSTCNQVKMTENIVNTLNMFVSQLGCINTSKDYLSRMLAVSQNFNDKLLVIDSLGLNQTRLTSAVSIALQKLSEIKEYELEDIPPIVAECYEAETEEEREVLKSVADPKLTKDKTEIQKKFSLCVWKIIVFLLCTVTSGTITSGIDKLINGNPPVINNYYVQNITNNLVVGGYDVDTLNSWGYRIVNKDIILRDKPGQKSCITGRLTKGKIVRVIGKYKKWVEVTWNDESGNEHFGWIQNYKLSTFSLN